MNGPARIHLHDALEQVINHYADVCTAATDTGGLLEHVTEVVSGGRARRRPDPPYLWVTVGAANAEHAHAMHEQWQVAVLLNAFVQSEDPEDGWLDAMLTASRARTVVLDDRDLGLGFVEDSQSAELGVLGQFTSGRRFGAYARVNTRIAIAEPPLEEPS